MCLINMPNSLNSDTNRVKVAPFYKVVACIDGRGFRERREDMREMLQKPVKDFTEETEPTGKVLHRSIVTRR